MEIKQVSQSKFANFHFISYCRLLINFANSLDPDWA